MVKTCTIQFNTHSVSVRQYEDGVFHTFKFNEQRCELETFTDREEVEEYILKPFPSVEYSLVIHEDD